MRLLERPPFPEKLLELELLELELLELELLAAARLGD
jgi:hypothetical protein